jgi:hypothetical protein
MVVRSFGTIRSKEQIQISDDTTTNPDAVRKKTTAGNNLIVPHGKQKTHGRSHKNMMTMQH